MGEEQEILTEEKAAFNLFLKTDIGGILKTGAAFLLGGIGVGVGVGDYEEQKRQKRISSIKDAVEGDIISLRGRKKGKLILTSNHLVLLFQTGFRKKVDKFVAIPLQFAKSVETASWPGLGKFLLMKFEVPAEEKPARFDLRIFVKNKEQWLTELTRLIQ